MPGIFPADIDRAAFSGAPTPSNFSADEKLACERLQLVYKKGIAYGFQMGLRPQTLFSLSQCFTGSHMASSSSGGGHSSTSSSRQIGKHFGKGDTTRICNNGLQAEALHDHSVVQIATPAARMLNDICS
jgi:hypothetical protein